MDPLKISFDGYVCSKCGASGVKLWRQYQTFLDHVDLMCAKCAGQDQAKDVTDIDADGRRTGSHGGRTDQIGWLVPAVPTYDGTFWGYASIPQDGVNWWRGLPSLP
jgi:hypothetical protein